MQSPSEGQIVKFSIKDGKSKDTRGLKVTVRK